MPMNKVKAGSNMYPFLNDYPIPNANKGYTWNVVKGKCPHDCSYCYMKVYPQPELHFDEAELKTNLGSGNFIFVGSSCDMWAETVSSRWVADILNHCIWYEDGNKYLFQSKNPHRFTEFSFPSDAVLGTTIETNQDYSISKAPSTWARYQEMKHLPQPKMVSIEPIMDFDPDVLLYWVNELQPEFVSIGADSKNNHLVEPDSDKIINLITELKGFTELKIKANLQRLLNIPLTNLP